MSATLGTLLYELQPDWKIVVYERLHDVGLESSNAWNNAGTGHAALCELNYTPEGARRHRRPGQGHLDQRAVPAEPAVLVDARRGGRAGRPVDVHQLDAAHDVRAR